MGLQRFEEVVLDREQRVQAGHRLLEDQPQLGPAHLVHLLGVDVEQVVIAIANLARGRGALGQQPQDAAAERRFAAAGLAHEPERLAFAELEGDAIHRSNRDTLGPVPDSQVAHREDWLIHGEPPSSTRHRRCLRGQGAGAARLPLRGSLGA